MFIPLDVYLNLTFAFNHVVVNLKHLVPQEKDTSISKHCLPLLKALKGTYNVKFQVHT